MIHIVSDRMKTFFQLVELNDRNNGWKSVWSGIVGSQTAARAQSKLHSAYTSSVKI